jgi:hypothetical protein
MTDDDILHNALLKVIEEQDSIEGDVIKHIERRIKMMKFQVDMDNRESHKIFDAYNQPDNKKDETEE